MFSSFLLLLPCYLFFLPLSLADQTSNQPAPGTLRLYHRIFHPSLSESLFYERASIHLAPDAHSASLVPSGALQTDLEHLAKIAQSVQGGTDAIYQVALEREGDADAGKWAISAVKAVSTIHFSPC